MTSPQNGCLTDDLVARLVGGQVTVYERADADRHIAGCDECRALVAEAARAAYDEPPGAADDDTSAKTRALGSSDDTPEAALLAPGTRVDRYVVGGLIGVGGMGVVYRAHDPQLNRPITLKLLRRDRRAGRRAQAQLLREAQAMAQLSHPSVVSVYDVGAFESEVFVAMEYVEGQTLRSWLTQQSPPRQWDTLRLAFAEAGAALAAAHAVGIVHRDFKPDNVLVGTDGRTRVMDFGLAVPLQSGEISSVDNDPNSDGLSGFGDWDLAMTLTHAGTVKGTPAYMAPEQFCGRAADARADQFSFCVTLYEALYGQRPYSPGAIKRFAYHGIGSDIVAPEQRGVVRQAARDALLQGLSLSPEERFPTMDDLLSALGMTAGHPTPRPTRRPLRWPRPAFALLAALLLASAVWVAYRSRLASISGTAPTSRHGSDPQLTDARSPSEPDASLAQKAPTNASSTHPPTAQERRIKADGKRARRTRRRAKRRVYDDAPMVPSFAK